jgi:DNA-binding MarR family transcriptional regulator
VADRLGFDASDMVGLVDSLEQGGYLTRQRDEADRRRYVLTATPTGRAVLEEIDVRSRQLRAEFLAPLSPQERATFQGLLRRLYAYHAARD